MKKKVIILILVIIVLALVIIMAEILKNNIENKKEKTNISYISFGSDTKMEVDKSKKEKIMQYNDYSIYFYDIKEVQFEYKGKTINLKESLKSKEINIEQVIKQSEEDVKNDKAYSTICLDGGSKLYKYDDFSILKMNSADGNKDVYIGQRNMGMSGVE